ncbi:putative coiled-coil domain-containing protein 196 isoform X2 [Sarcophilus harrisii]|uniref:putative coiled-coil domain-containing protein 196 isoform X2 n=1 Tax=Sarcophilus harrisii TaxID=9305 RepID=UPI001301AF60|nr:putative coiled-coil domain-containing protein 196 isoform X2 [Sarcophilus harrisii]
MTTNTNSSTSFLKSRTRNSRPQDSYLSELNEDLKIRKRELMEILKPLEEKNGTLLQNLMTNLEEKQKSLQIMRQIMAEKGGDSDDTIVLEMIEEAEELKQNLQAIEDEYRMRQKAMLLKSKAEMQELKERLQRNKEHFTFRDEIDDVQELHSRVIEEKIEALTKHQKTSDLQLLHSLKQDLDIPQFNSKLLISPRYSRLTCTGKNSACDCGVPGVLRERNDATSRSSWDTEESPQSASPKKPGCQRGTFFSEASPRRQYSSFSSHPRIVQSFFQAPHGALPRLPGSGRQLSKGTGYSPQEPYASVILHARGLPCAHNTFQGALKQRLRRRHPLWQKVQEEY